MKAEFRVWFGKWWGVIASWAITVGLVVGGLLAYRFASQLSGLVGAAMGGSVCGLMSVVLTICVATGRETPSI